MNINQIKKRLEKAVAEFRKEKKIADENFHLSEESFASFFIVK